MSCRGPSAGNTLLSRLIETVFQLRTVRQIGVTVDEINSLYQQEHPGLNTLAEVQQSLRNGARRGVFTRCEFPNYSGEFYFNFNQAMIYSNWKNRQFGIPIIMDTVKSGSAFRCGGKSLPLACQCTNIRGVQIGNNLPCCVPPPDPLLRPPLAASFLDRRNLQCCQ